MKTKMRATSLVAFTDILESIGERQMQVLKAFRQIQPATNLMISKHLNLPINCITGRCSELRKMHIIMMDRIDICEFTGRKVIYWRIKKWLNEVMN